MFDIGFWELAMLAVIALLVVGPDRLPRLAHTAGIWFGKMRNLLASVKADVESELRAEELKRIVEEQARDTSVHEIVEETKSTLDDTRSSLDETKAAVDELERDFRRAGKSVEDGAEPGADAQDKEAMPAPEPDKERERPRAPSDSDDANAVKPGDSRRS